MSSGDLLASLLGSQLCWAPIWGKLSFASVTGAAGLHKWEVSWLGFPRREGSAARDSRALLTSINRRSASWASLAGKAQLRQGIEKGAADLHKKEVS